MAYLVNYESEKRTSRDSMWHKDHGQGFCGRVTVWFHANTEDEWFPCTIDDSETIQNNAEHYDWYENLTLINFLDYIDDWKEGIVYKITGDFWEHGFERWTDYGWEPDAEGWLENWSVEITDLDPEFDVHEPLEFD